MTSITLCDCSESFSVVVTSLVVMVCFLLSSCMCGDGLAVTTQH